MVFIYDCKYFQPNVISSLPNPQSELSTISSWLQIVAGESFLSNIIVKSNVQYPLRSFDSVAGLTFKKIFFHTF